MNLFIPEIGSKIKLTRDWEFILQNEYRNSSLMKKVTGDIPSKSPKNKIVTIPEGTVLTVDRIYIRKGVSSHSSITFNISKKENKKHEYAGVRFWAALSDVNNVEYELLTCNEETLAVVNKIYNILRVELESNYLNLFIPLITDGEPAINKFRPQINSFSLLKKALINVSEFKTINNDRYENAKSLVHKTLESELRKYKIEMLLEE